MCAFRCQKAKELMPNILGPTSAISNIVCSRHSFAQRICVTGPKRVCYEWYVEPPATAPIPTPMHGGKSHGCNVSNHFYTYRFVHIVAKDDGLEMVTPSKHSSLGCLHVLHVLFKIFIQKNIFNIHVISLLKRCWWDISHVTEVPATGCQPTCLSLATDQLKLPGSCKDQPSNRAWNETWDTYIPAMKFVIGFLVRI